MPSTFEFESGFSLIVPQTTTLNVAGTNAVVQEQDTLTITSASDPTLSRTLEIDSDGTTFAGSIPVDVSAAGTVFQVRDAILAALSSPDPILAPLTVAEVLELEPVAIGTNQLQLGTTATHQISGGFTAVSITGQLGGVEDGDVFSYTRAPAVRSTLS